MVEQPGGLTARKLQKTHTTKPIKTNKTCQIIAKVLQNSVVQACTTTINSDAVQDFLDSGQIVCGLHAPSGRSSTRIIPVPRQASQDLRRIPGKFPLPWQRGQIVCTGASFAMRFSPSVVVPRMAGTRARVLFRRFYFPAEGGTAHPDRGRSCPKSKERRPKSAG